MTNRDRAIFGTAWALILAGITVIAILAIHPIASGTTATARPVWNGQGIYDSGTEPLCPAADAGHVSWVGPHRLIQVTCRWNVTEFDWTTTGQTR